jgi:hypothetical protein
MEWVGLTKFVKRILATRDVIIDELLYFAIRQPELFSWETIGLLYWHLDNRPYERERFSEVINGMISTHRIVVEGGGVSHKTGGIKKLLKRRTND